MENNNFLPVFNISDSLSSDLRQIEIAKKLSEGWYKGQIDYYLRKINGTFWIDGEEYYHSIYGILDSTTRFKVKGTRDYYIAEFCRLLGLEDQDLQQFTDIATGGGSDGIYLTWKYKNEISKESFKHYVGIIDTYMNDVDTIEIEYENQRYRSDIYTTEASRVYNNRASLYGNYIQWGSAIGELNSTSWEQKKYLFYVPEVQTKPTNLSFGKNVKFKRAEIDVTSEFTPELIQVIQTMIAYSGEDFMIKLSESKVGETTYIGEDYNYISARGVEVYDANVKNSFLMDTDNIQYKRYTSFKGSERTDILEGRDSLTGNEFGIKYFTWKFWDFTKIPSNGAEAGASWVQERIVGVGDEFLFRSSGDQNVGAFLKVKAFQKLSMKEVSYYFGNYFNVRVTQKKSGGFFSGFVGAIAGLLGKIFDFGFDLISIVPALRLSLQIFTKVVNALFKTDLTPKEVFRIGLQIAWTSIGIVLTPFTFGVSLAISTAIALAIAGSDSNEKKKELEEKARQQEEENKKRKEEKDTQAEEDAMKKRIDTEGSEEEKMNLFLKDPLYQLDRELNEIDISMKKQFNLL